MNAELSMIDQESHLREEEKQSDHFSEQGEQSSDSSLDQLGEEIGDQELAKLEEDSSKEDLQEKFPGRSIYIKDNFVYLTKGQDVQKIPLEQYQRDVLKIEIPNTIIARKTQLAFEVANIWKNSVLNAYPAIQDTTITKTTIVTLRNALAHIDQNMSMIQSQTTVPTNQELDRFTNTIKDVIVDTESQVSIIGIKDIEAMFDKIYHDAKDTPEQYETTRVNILNHFRKQTLRDYVRGFDTRGGNSLIIQATFGSELIKTPDFYHVRSLFESKEFLQSLKDGSFEYSHNPQIIALFQNLGGEYEMRQVQELFKKVRINGPKQKLDNDQIALNFINSLQLHLTTKQLERNPKLRENNPKAKSYRDIVKEDLPLDTYVTRGKELAIQGVCLFVSGGVANIVTSSVRGAVRGSRLVGATKALQAGRALKAVDFVGSVALEGTLFHAANAVVHNSVKGMLGEETHLRDELKDAQGYAKSVAFMGVLKGLHGALGKLTTTSTKAGNIVKKDRYASFANPKNPVGKLFFKEAAEKGITTNILGSMVKFTGEGMLLTVAGVSVDVGFGDRERHEWTWEELVQGILLSMMLAQGHKITGKLQVYKQPDGTISVSEIISKVEQISGISFSEGQKSKIEQFSKVKKIEGNVLQEKLEKQIVSSWNNKLLPEQNNNVIKEILLTSNQSTYKTGGKIDNSTLNQDIDMIQKAIQDIHAQRTILDPKDVYRDGTGAGGDLYNLTAKEIARTQEIMTKLELSGGKKLTREEVTKLMDEGVLGKVNKKGELLDVSKKALESEINSLYTVFSKGKPNDILESKMLLDSIEVIEKNKKIEGVGIVDIDTTKMEQLLEMKKHCLQIQSNKTIETYQLYVKELEDKISNHPEQYTEIQRIFKNAEDKFVLLGNHEKNKIQGSGKTIEKEWSEIKGKKIAYERNGIKIEFNNDFKLSLDQIAKQIEVVLNEIFSSNANSLIFKDVNGSIVTVNAGPKKIGEIKNFNADPFFSELIKDYKGVNNKISDKEKKDGNKYFEYTQKRINDIQAGINIIEKIQKDNPHFALSGKIGGKGDIELYFKKFYDNRQKTKESGGNEVDGQKIYSNDDFSDGSTFDTKYKTFKTIMENYITLNRRNEMRVTRDNANKYMDNHNTVAAQAEREKLLGDGGDKKGLYGDLYIIGFAGKDLKDEINYKTETYIGVGEKLKEEFNNIKKDLEAKIPLKEGTTTDLYNLIDELEAKTVNFTKTANVKVKNKEQLAQEYFDILMLRHKLKGKGFDAGSLSKDSPKDVQYINKISSASKIFDNRYDGMVKNSGFWNKNFWRSTGLTKEIGKEANTRLQKGGLTEVQENIIRDIEKSTHDYDGDPIQRKMYEILSDLPGTPDGIKERAASTLASLLGYTSKLPLIKNVMTKFGVDTSSSIDLRSDNARKLLENANEKGKVLTHAIRPMLMDGAGLAWGLLQGDVALLLGSATGFTTDYLGYTILYMRLTNSPMGRRLMSLMWYGLVRGLVIDKMIVGAGGKTFYPAWLSFQGLYNNFMKHSEEKRKYDFRDHKNRSDEEMKKMNTQDQQLRYQFQMTNSPENMRKIFERINKNKNELLKVINEVRSGSLKGDLMQGSNSNNNSNNSNNNTPVNPQTPEQPATPKRDESNAERVKDLIFESDNRADVEVIYGGLSDQKKLQILSSGKYTP